MGENVTELNTAFTGFMDLAQGLIKKGGDIRLKFICP